MALWRDGLPDVLVELGPYEVGLRHTAPLELRLQSAINPPVGSRFGPRQRKTGKTVSRHRGTVVAQDNSQSSVTKAMDVCR